ncbi:CAP-Gly domain-containing linker protein 1, partial [Pseudolycoriella hygida]
SDTAQGSETADEQKENLDSLNVTEHIENISANTEAVQSEGQSSENIIEETQKEQSENISTEEQTKIENKIPRTLRNSTTSSEANEEVDDIELIFSSDDKEHLQEDLVSISDFEPWEKAGATGTPVLVNFGAISSSEDLNNKSENIQSSYNMETDQEAMKNRTTMKRDESVDTFEQVEINSSSTGLGRRWTNHNVLIETDISKCGIAEESIIDMGRRNTCPNPPSYRPLMHRETLAQSRHTSTRCPLAVKFSRNSRTHCHPSNRSARPILQESNKCEPKRSSSAQTEISALPEHWQSESNLISGRYGDGFYTLPSKFVPPLSLGKNRRPSQMTAKTQDARRVMLSDINFTSMVPELSRSADHLCQDDNFNRNAGDSSYYKGSHLQTPDCVKGITPSASMTSPGVSQWTVNENSFGTQTTQTDNFWNNCDSFDSSKSYTMGSRFSTILNKSHRSRSVPSIQCSICKQNHGRLRISESMHYTPRVTFKEPNSSNSVRGSLPDLRNECACMHRRYTCGRPSLLQLHAYSSGSTESLLDEADDFLNKSVDGMSNFKGDRKTKEVNRRRSENDIKRDYSPSKQSLPFLPKSPKCLKLGHLAKVITKTGRVVIGRVRYLGPLASSQFGEGESFVGLQLPNSLGDCDGTIDGRKFFDCEPQHGIFVPFQKIVMAWTA